MARGNKIIVSAYPEGMFNEGPLAGAYKPGTVVQIDPTVALVGGRHTFTVYDRAADGDRTKGPLYVVIENYLLGKTCDVAYAAGDRGFVYCPEEGEELNMLLGDVAGTGDDHLAGEMLMIDDGTGKLVATTGSPQSEPFTLLENVTDPVTDTLAWCVFNGR